MYQITNIEKKYKKISIIFYMAHLRILVIGGFGTNKKYMLPFCKELHTILNNKYNKEYNNIELINYALSHKNTFQDEIKCIIGQLKKDESYIIIGFSVGCSIALELCSYINVLKVILCNPLNIDNQFSPEFLDAIYPERNKEEKEKEKEEEEEELYFLTEFYNSICDFTNLYLGITYETDDMIDAPYNFWIPIIWIFKMTWNFLLQWNAIWILSRIYYECYGKMNCEIDYNGLVTKSDIFSIRFEDFLLTIREFVIKPNLYNLIDKCECPVDILVGNNDLYLEFTKTLRKENDKKTTLYYMIGDHHILYNSPVTSADFIEELL
jgi:surfactin synthase thioesterase subunit